MSHSSLYLTNLYNDLITNTPQTITMDIPSEVGQGQISQTKIKHGVILSDWKMCYQSDMNVQGPVSGEYMQIIFCLNVADGLFCREIDGLFCRSSPDIIVRRRCVLSHKRRGWLQPSPSFRYSRNLALQDELYHPVINNGPAVLVCVDKRLGTGPVNQSRDAG